MFDLRRVLPLAALGLLTVLAAPAVLAQDGDKPTWYRVEVIVFDQQDNYGEEGHRRDIELSYPQNLVFPAYRDEVAGDEQELTEALARATEADKATDGDKETEAPFDAYVWLEEDQRDLNPDAYSLDRTGVYKVLFHEAWRQPVAGPRRQPWLLVAAGPVHGDHRALEGSVRLYRSRYLHFEADLWRTRFGAAQFEPVSEPNEQTQEQTPEVRWPALPPVPKPPQAQADETETNEPEIEATGPAQETVFVLQRQQPRYQVRSIDFLDQSRRVPEDALLYLDHPRLGVIVKVTPLEVDDEQTEAESSAADPGDNRG